MLLPCSIMLPDSVVLSARKPRSHFATHCPQHLTERFRASNSQASLRWHSQSGRAVQVRPKRVEQGGCVVILVWAFDRALFRTVTTRRMPTWSSRSSRQSSKASNWRSAVQAGLVQSPLITSCSTFHSCVSMLRCCRRVRASSSTMLPRSLPCWATGPPSSTYSLSHCHLGTRWRMFGRTRRVQHPLCFVG